MPYEAQMAQLAQCAIGHHGRLSEVVFVSPNKDCRLVFSDGTVIAPEDDGSLKREYSTYSGYGEIAQQLGGTHPFSLLAFGYQGTGPQCFTTFLNAAGFASVQLSEMVNLTDPARLRPDGSFVKGRWHDHVVEWDDGSETPAITLGPAE